MFEKLDNFVLSNDNIDLDDTKSGIVTFFSDDLILVTKDLNNINLDGDNFDENDPEIIIHDWIMACCNRYKTT